MAQGAVKLMPLALVMFIGSCGLEVGGSTNSLFETRFLFLNFSRTTYVALGLRDSSNVGAGFVLTPLLPPGAVFRAEFRELTQAGCPGFIDLRLLVYRRINESVPIGLDEGEAIEQFPSAAADLLTVPACSAEPQAVFTIVNWDAPDGTARVKIAQGTRVVARLRNFPGFNNVDVAWEVDGVESSLANIAPPAPAANRPIAGRVTRQDGSGVAGVGVLLRTRFRVRLGGNETGIDPDTGFSDPIAFTTTDELGEFSIDRPPGGYQVEFFSDDFEFRPANVFLETPIAFVQIIADPL